MLLQANKLEIYVEARLLLKIDHLQIDNNDRIGLVGKNGTGKTTLLHTLAGKIKAETGEITRFTTMHLLPQLKEIDRTKSGGELTQRYIQEAFAVKSSILFADEPTTNLDTKHIEWVEKTLKHWENSFVIVSHDRTILNRLCTKIWEIDNKTIKEYKGNYQQYKYQKDLEQQHQVMEYEKYQKKKQQLEEAIIKKSEKAERATKKPKGVSQSEASITGAKPYFAKKQKKLQQTARSIETRLEQLDKVEKPFEHAPIKMNLPDIKKQVNKPIIRAEDEEISIGSIELLHKASFLIHGGEKIAIVGPNGCGKTTLLKEMIRDNTRFKLSPRVKFGYFSQDLSILKLEKTILQNMKDSSTQEESLIRTVLARLHFFNDDVHKEVQVLSGGERVKVLLAKIFLSDCNVLILDEPTNFLDTEAVEALEDLLKGYEGTIIFVSHDRQFVKNIATRIFSIENKTLSIVNNAEEDVKVTLPSATEEQKLILETKITECLGRLSLEPTAELEREFQQLLIEKKKLD